MSAQKSFFRNVYDAMVEARSRQAERELSYYRKMFDLDGTPKR